MSARLILSSEALAVSVLVSAPEKTGGEFRTIAGIDGLSLCPTPGREVLRLDWHAVDDPALRLQLLFHGLRAFQPLLEMALQRRVQPAMGARVEGWRLALMERVAAVRGIGS